MRKNFYSTFLLLTERARLNSMTGKNLRHNKNDFQKAERGEELSDADAMDEATSLLTMMNAIYRPIKKEWMDDYEIREGIKNNGFKQGKI